MHIFHSKMMESFLKRVCESDCVRGELVVTNTRAFEKEAPVYFMV